MLAVIQDANLDSLTPERARSQILRNSILLQGPADEKQRYYKIGKRRGRRLGILV